MVLDYNLNTPDERNRYLHNLNLSALNPHQLELCANYLLHTVDKSLSNSTPQNRSSNKKNNELDPNNGQATEITPKKGGNYYTSPPNPVPWDHFALVDLKEGIDNLVAIRDNETEPTRKYYLSRWITELRLDARLRLPEPTMNVSASFTSTPPIELEEAGLDWTNTFHLKHVCRYYSRLRQDENAKWDIYYFDKLVEQTPLEPWQKHILIRYIDGQNAIITARELAYNFGKMVHPGYTSVVLRSIYAKIAKTATKEIVRQKAKEGKIALRKCPTCGKTHPDHELWWRKGQRKCKACLVKANG